MVICFWNSFGNDLGSNGTRLESENAPGQRIEDHPHPQQNRLIWYKSRGLYAIRPLYFAEGRSIVTRYDPSFLWPFLYGPPVPNISTLTILIRQGKSSQNAHSGSPEWNFLEFPGSTFSLALLYSLKGNPEFPWISRNFSGISRERALGIPESRFRGKMKLICWAAVIYHRGQNYYKSILVKYIMIYIYHYYNFLFFILGLEALNFVWLLQKHS